MDLTPKQQTSEAIRQAETILILTGQHPSVDQATAVIALTAILRKFGKTVTPMISDNPPTSVNMLDSSVIERTLGGQRDFILKLDVTKSTVDTMNTELADGKLNIYITPAKGSFAPSDVTFGYGGTSISYDLAIVLGVPTRARIDRAFEQNSQAFESIPLLNLDFHRSNENYGAVNLIEPNASSLCEMLVALSESLQSGIIDAEIATALLMGIVASTDRFTAAHTSPKSLTVAAQMMAAGARQQAVMKALYRDGKSADGRDGGRSDRGERSSDRSDRDKGRDGGRDGQNRQQQPRNEQSPRGDQSRNEQSRSDQARAEQRQSEPVRQEARAEQPRQEQPRAEQPRAEQPRQAEQLRTEQPRSEARQPEPQAAPQPQPAQQSTAALAAAALTAVNEHLAQTPAEAPAPVQPAPMQVPHYDDAHADDNVIIQPGHIELMQEAQPAPAQPQAQPQPAAAQPQTPAQPQAPQGRPQSMPVADFAAAAEMFKREPAQQPRSDQDAA